MKDDLVFIIRELAARTNAEIGYSKWYLFGSAQGDFSNVMDIDLLAVCETHAMADMIRQSVDLDQLTRPIHLSILTQVEEAEVHFVKNQDCIQIL
jgi:predicted nucleotidyltransferase